MLITVTAQFDLVSTPHSITVNSSEQYKRLPNNIISAYFELMRLNMYLLRPVINGTEIHDVST